MRHIHPANLWKSFDLATLQVGRHPVRIQGPLRDPGTQAPWLFDAVDSLSWFKTAITLGFMDVYGIYGQLWLTYGSCNHSDRGYRML